MKAVTSPALRSQSTEARHCSRLAADHLGWKLDCGRKPYWSPGAAAKTAAWPSARFRGATGGESRGPASPDSDLERRQQRRVRDKDGGGGCRVPPARSELGSVWRSLSGGDQGVSRAASRQARHGRLISGVETRYGRFDPRVHRLGG